MNMNLLDRPTTTPHVADDLSRRELITGLAAAGLMASCGRTGTEARPAAPATRVVRDSASEVKVPVAPERVVTMWRFIGPHVVSLGVPLVGTGQPQALPIATDMPVWLAWNPPADLAVFDQNAPNLEVVACLGPDLILAMPGAEELDALRAIAPTAQIAGAARDYEDQLHGDIYNGCSYAAAGELLRQLGDALA